MAKKKRTDTYSKHHEAAWEGRRDYYEYNGIRDSRTGWMKRLNLSPNGFGNRLKLFKEGKISKELLFRPAGHGKQVHTKYEIKMPREEFVKSRHKNLKKRWEGVELCPKNVTIRVWETVFDALKSIKPVEKCWSQFFIDKFKLPVKVPAGAKYARR